MNENFKPSFRANTREPIGASIRTTDSSDWERRRDTLGANIQQATGPDGKVDMGMLWSGVLDALEGMSPEERSPLLAKLNKRVATNWGKENAVGMRSNDFGAPPLSNDRQNEINRDYWKERLGDHVCVDPIQGQFVSQATFNELKGR